MQVGVITCKIVHALLSSVPCEIGSRQTSRLRIEGSQSESALAHCWFAPNIDSDGRN